jgi:hypothetical protein
VKGRVNPVPDYVRRINNAAVQYGGAAGSVIIWPSAKPSLIVEPGERLSLALRVRPSTVTEHFDLELAAGAPPFCSLRREQSGGGLFVEIALQAPADSTTYTIPLKRTDGTPEDLKVPLELKVLSDNLSVRPAELDLGQVSLRAVSAGAQRVGRVGIQKKAGTFRISSLSSTLPFLKLEQQTIIEGSNYVVRVSVAEDKAPGPGSYSGTVRIETGQKRFDVPVKVKITD